MVEPFATAGARGRGCRTEAGFGKVSRRSYSGHRMVMATAWSIRRRRNRLMPTRARSPKLGASPVALQPVLEPPSVTGDSTCAIAPASARPVPPADDVAAAAPADGHATSSGLVARTIPSWNTVESGVIPATR
jgi:hypothetical protein